jgi:hypothetical protein
MTNERISQVWESSVSRPRSGIERAGRATALDVIDAQRTLASAERTSAQLDFH